MLVYSQSIIAFIEEIKTLTKQILRDELQLKVVKNRFYNKEGSFSYPILIVIYNNKKTTLGYFDPEFYELGFHQLLMYKDITLLKNVIRHELAHYLLFTEGYIDEGHGPRFKAFCQKLRWGKEVYQTTLALENPLEDKSYETPLVRKFKKLVALSKSHNTHEANLALMKSQKLLLDYNLDVNDKIKSDQNPIILKRILKQKKQNSKLLSIAKILETFFVNTIFHASSNHLYLEISGYAHNVDIAEYVGNVLYEKFESLWCDTKKTCPNLKGLKAKNSFFLGIALGYCQKVQALKLPSSSQKGLISIEKNLSLIKDMIYPHLRALNHRHKKCHLSSSLGESLGKNLNIYPALTPSKKEKSPPLISMKP